MKITEPFLFNDEDLYADVWTCIQVGAQDWKFIMSLEKETQTIYDSDLEVAEHPDGCFDHAPGDAPGVVQRAYDKLRPKAAALLEALKRPQRLEINIHQQLHFSDDGQLYTTFHGRPEMTLAQEQPDEEDAGYRKELLTEVCRRFNAYPDLMDKLQPIEGYLANKAYHGDELAGSLRKLLLEQLK